MAKLELKMEIKAFTLAELLIALAILGVIATFTIPKLLTAQSKADYNAAGKECAATVSNALLLYKQDHTVDGNTYVKDLTPFINYVRIISSGVTMDDHYTQGATPACDGTGYLCLKFHNGGVMHFGAGAHMGTDPVKNNGMTFEFDPDGQLTQGGTTNNFAKSVQFWIYINGRVMTRGTHLDNSCDGGGCNTSAWPAADPPWLSWN